MKLLKEELERSEQDGVNLKEEIQEQRVSFLNKAKETERVSREALAELETLVDKK